MPRSALLIVALAASVAFNSFLTTASAEELCSTPPSSYVIAKYRYPQLVSAFTELQKHTIAT